MKYEIKWLWYGAEQNAIVKNEDDGAKPLCVIYEFENNICRIDRYTVLWSNQEWDWNLSDFKPAKIVPIQEYRVANPRWVIRNSIPDWGREFNTYSLYIDGQYCFEYVDRPEEYERKRIVDWFIEHQPNIKQWQVDFLCANPSKQGLLYLKASIEHEHD